MFPPCLTIYLGLRRKKGTAFRCQRPETNVLLTKSCLFFFPLGGWVRQKQQGRARRSKEGTSLRLKRRWLSGAGCPGGGWMAHAPQAPQTHGLRMTSEAWERAERRRGRSRRAGGGAWRCSESAPPPSSVPAPRSARASLPAPSFGRPQRARRPCSQRHPGLRRAPRLLPFRRRRRRTRSRRPGPGRSWGVRGARSQPFPLRLPHRSPPPLALLLSPPCSFTASSSSSSSSPGPSCQHHVRRGRFWEPAAKIQVGFPRGAER